LLVLAAKLPKPFIFAAYHAFSMPTNPSVLIVGAGMAGLTCALYLKRAGIDATLLEAGDGVGGRVRTDTHDGFQFDRGFQILLTAYPETNRLLDYNALQLKTFRSGALIRQDGDWTRLLNPLREPESVLKTLFSTAGNLGDKLNIVRLITRTAGLSAQDFFHQEATTTQQFLREYGYSERMINTFFRPFFGGVFLEDRLTTSSNFFEFCFRYFYTGDAAVPAAGIGAIPAQLAAQLAPGQVRLNTAVSQVQEGQVILADGQTLSADVVVLAVDAAAADRLLGRPASDRTFNRTTTTYFAAPASPQPDRLLMLNPDRQSVVHNLCVLSDVAPAYAPAGQSLISVSTQGLTSVDEAALTRQIQQELKSWFGEAVEQWSYLRTYHLPEALPAYGPESRHAPLRLSDGLYQCGDQAAYPSLNAAMETGRKVAEAISKG